MPTDAVATAGAHRRDPALELRVVLRNGRSLLGAYLLPRAFTFAATVVAARALGVAEFGAYGSAAALAVILSLVATLGMMQLLVREVARAPERAAELVGAANVVKAASVLAMLVALWALTAGALDYPPRVVGAALLLGAAYGVGAFGENLGGYFQGLERMGVWLQAQALYGVVFGTLGIALALATRDLLWFCAAPLVGQTAALAWLLRSAPPELRLARAVPPRLLGTLIRAVLPFAAAFAILSAYYKVDILLLERWRGLADAGVYAAAYRFVDVAQALAVVVASALYPRLSRLAVAPAKPHRRHGGGRAAELLVLAAVPAAAVLWLVRDPTVRLLFGDAFAAAAPVLGLLAAALPLLALNALGAFVLAAMDRIGAVAALYAAGVALNVALNALLIPPLGAAGAATAMLGSEAALAAGTFVLLRARGAAPTVRTLAIALAAGLLAPLLAATDWPLGAVVPAYGVAVAGLYIVLRVMPREERRLLARAVTG